MVILDYILLFLLLFVLAWFFYSALSLEKQKQKKFMRLYDEMYIYFKKLNKGENENV